MIVSIYSSLQILQTKWHISLKISYAFSCISMKMRALRKTFTRLGNFLVCLFRIHLWPAYGEAWVSDGTWRWWDRMICEPQQSKLFFCDFHYYYRHLSFPIIQTELANLTNLPTFSAKLKKIGGCQMVTHPSIAQANCCLTSLTSPLTPMALSVNSCLYCTSLRHFTGGILLSL